jgi:hypothetical protein
MSHALQVYIDDDDFRALEGWARERGWSLSQAVRVALRALTRAGREDDPLLAASGMIDGLPADLSRRFDEHLAATYVAEPVAPYSSSPRKRRARKTVRR